MHPHRTLLTVAALAAALLVPPLLSGCNRDDQITAYQAPKDPKPEPGEQTASASPTVVPTGSTPIPQIPGLTYNPPEGWQPMPPHQFEAARFAVGGDAKTAFTVSILPGGFDLAQNVQRWAGQVGLKKSSDELAAATTSTKVGGVDAKSLDLKGDAQQMLLAIVPQAGQTYIFKLLGPTDKVTGAKANFDALVQSVKFQGAAETAAASDTPTPFVRPPAAPPASPSSADAPPQLPFTFTAPADWKLDPQPRTFRLATWLIGSGDATAEVFVPGPMNPQGFDVPGNINRWRGQVGLPPGNDTQPTDVKIGNQPGKLVDLSGPAANGKPAQRLIVAFVTGKDALWFFKIQGAADVVSQQKPAFEKFLETVQFKPGAL